MKLELKHLVPYLPYDLNFYVEHLDGKRMDNWVMNIDTNLRDVLRFQNKPILRPMRDIIKEVKSGDGLFVPIKTLALLNDFGVDEFSYNSDSAKEGVNCCWFDYTDDEWDADRRFYYDCTYKSFQFGGLNPSSYKPVRNQYELFQKLFEWHFDVFGLIEQGLAVDINTL